MACETQACGHCKSLEEDDQCGLPEHRYCILCQLKKCSDESDTDCARAVVALREIVEKLESLFGLPHLQEEDGFCSDLWGVAKRGLGEPVKPEPGD